MPASRMARDISLRSGVDTAVCTAVLRGAAEAIAYAWRQGLPVHLPGVGTIEPVYFKARSVACNLPGRIRRRYNVGVRKSARLRPAPNLRNEEPYTGAALSSPPNRGGLTFIVP